MRSNIAALIIGLIFGVGLTISQMVNPAKVLNFLDIFGAWDPSLVFVMAGAVLTTAIGYSIVLRRSRPVLSESFVVPTLRDIDAKLVIGAVLFGIGWGLSGFCPGPALTALTIGGFPVLIFVMSMVAGMFAANKFNS